MSQKIIIHGGAGRRPRSRKRVEEVRAVIRKVLEQSYPILEEGGALDAVVHAVALLEDSPIFNAGTGSRLQADGKARMTASLMDGDTQKFSAVINIENVRNPIKVAHVLQ
ncbi:MAG: isoaspartyl peptidase/L-asparaginase, partial [Candidatus Brocadiales bacterium]